MSMDYKKLVSEASKADKTLLKELTRKDSVETAETSGPASERASEEPKPVPKRKKPSAPVATAQDKKEPAPFDVVDPPAREILSEHINLLVTPSMKNNLANLVAEKKFRSMNAAAIAILDAYFKA